MLSDDLEKTATCSRCGKEKIIEIQTTIRRKNGSEWTEWLCEESADKQYPR